VTPDGRPADDGSFLGLDNVAIEIPIAGVGTRILAAFLDTLIITVLMILVMIAAVTAASVTGKPWVALVIYVAGGFLLNWGYFTIAEIATRGQTPGKRLFKLRVVTEDGGVPTAGALTIRNLLRIIDTFVGVILMAVDPRSRRLGDRLAGTLVVHDTADGAQSLVLSRIPTGWEPSKVALVEAFFDRSQSMDHDRQQLLARRILALIERDDPEFLIDVAPAQTASGTLWRAFRPDWI